MTKIMGIVNVTHNSFSDGGKYNSTQAAIKHIHTLFEEGADLVDIGAASTSYNAELISPSEEWSILEPILKAIDRSKISIDTYHYQTAEKAIDLGVGWINDVSFGRDKNMLKVIAQSDVKYILMHSLVLPANKNIRVANINEIQQNFATKLAECIEGGIAKDRIILDPGLGFSTNSEQSMELINKLDILKIFGTEIMIGHSRKSFLNSSHISEPPPHDRDIETLVISLYLKSQVNYLRVHNVAWHKRAFNMHDICIMQY